MNNLAHQLKNISLSPIILGKEIGKGGEGAVFSIKNSSDLIVKTYHNPITTERADKILSMVAQKNERLLNLAAWPLASYHEKDGRLSGFIMPWLKNYLPLFELYNPSLRLQKFPQADWRFLVHSAINVAKAFSVIHEAGHVIGDVNHGNLLVAQDATVRFIDTDSFQIYANAKYWLCDVGVPSYQPSEMQLVSFKDIIRTPNHDNFGLAILIFHLLFLGRHPFSGRFQGKGEMPIEKAISEFRFAYSRNQQRTQMLPPPASLPMVGLSDELHSLFERAFSKEGCGDKVGLRPKPNEWITALSDFGTKLKSCSLNEGHYYFKNLNECPWCSIEKIGGPVFPFRGNSQKQHTTTKSTQQSLQNLLEKTIRDIDQENLAVTYPKFIFSAGTATNEVISLKSKLDFLKFYLFYPTFFTLLVVLFFAISNPEHWNNLGHILVTFMLFGTFVSYKVYEKALSKNFKSTFSQFKTEKKKLIKNAKSQNYNFSLEKVKKQLNELNKSYTEINSNRSKLIKQQESKLRSERLQSTLQNAYIKNANIEGIGRERIKTLKSYGIERAIDVVDYRLQGIKGFGEVIRGRLIRWRNNIEYSINSQPVILTPSKIADIDRIIEGQIELIATELSDSLNKYTTLAQQIKEHNKNIETEAAILVKKYSQALIDAQVLGYKL